MFLDGLGGAMYRYLLHLSCIVVLLYYFDFVVHCLVFLFVLVSMQHMKPEINIGCSHFHQNLVGPSCSVLRSQSLLKLAEFMAQIAFAI